MGGCDGARAPEANGPTVEGPESAQAVDPAREDPPPDSVPPQETPPEETPPEDDAVAVAIVALASMRTSGRPPHVRLRVDNGSDEVTRARVRTVTALSEDGTPDHGVTVREVRAETVPFGQVYPPSDEAVADIDDWQAVAARSSRVLDLELDEHVPYRPMAGRYTYRVELVLGEGDERTVDLVLSDAIRHPIRH